MLPRVVEPEILDGLPPADPGALASRADLRRLNLLLGHAGVLAAAWRGHQRPPVHRRACELGAGDGTLSLEIVRRLKRRERPAHVLLLDRQNLLAEGTLRSLRALDCQPECVEADVFAWLEQTPPPVDVMFANLFLHHFPDPQLRTLLRLASERTHLFIACEPRRSRIALTAARLVGLLGCHAVTRHDAVVSVRAGFTGQELSALWPAGQGWSLHEHAAGFCSHCFIAEKNA